MFLSIHKIAVWAELVLVVFETTSVTQKNRALKNIREPPLSPLRGCLSSTVFTKMFQVRHHVSSNVDVWGRRPLYVHPHLRKKKKTGESHI
jgi:hypothetical protein